ncbi:adenylate/guanylate cyclase domain-containing protein [Fulvivirga sp. 29W222]|uniref:Adenylate/guanylate cyclase domain-containing protein n=1 Tax=Fulvivirga marina TaxID=2494733 RepID=A0A937G0N6_9BACT|nr:adenylate/guanylate cyclase domain-containing protein [Fulvivirga marina]MBL6447825.1 adenylate/guanylate cyclase domain-containing protein [Fulvivirga marina]
MKQLSLFTPSISQSLQLDFKRRLKKSHRSSAQDTYQRDLWTQDKEEEREMALFFLDIRNFTPLVEKHMAHDVIYIIRKLFSTFQTIIRSNHGQIIETSGDGFYAAFGFDRPVKSAVASAIKAGKAILESLEGLNENVFIKKLNHRIDVGIGLHAGRVATGTIHLNGKDHLIVMGYPVNIAARLEAATKELNNSLIISASAFEMLNDPPTGQPTAEISLKGVAGPFRIHLLGKSYNGN